jgi:deoxyribodipyrimidine photo-lyase
MKKNTIDEFLKLAQNVLSKDKLVKIKIFDKKVIFMNNIALVWFRNDLRLCDHPAFSGGYHHYPLVIPLYILDEKRNSLGKAQQWWLYHSLQSLDNDLRKNDLHLILRRGNPIEIIKKIVHEYSIGHVYWNRCYEPDAISRDRQIKSMLIDAGIPVETSNATLLNEPWTIKNTQGSYFKVYTAFWKESLKILPPPPKAKEIHLSQGASMHPIPSDNLDDWNLLPTHPDWASKFTSYWTPGQRGAQEKLDQFLDHHVGTYHEHRDIPSLSSTSHLSPHLHFGEISVHHVWRQLHQLKKCHSHHETGVESFKRQIGWREFSYYLLYHFPTFGHQNFKQNFDDFPWQQNSALVQAWEKGQTGYPIIDAGMRELWNSGFMHNRVRMIVASFLTKNLLIDWRVGAKWFFDTLLDADLANNSMGWQWVAGSGVDASPYFRIFNPILQSEKFDPSADYIRTWVPELRELPSTHIHDPWSFSQDDCRSRGYPKPIVDYRSSRLRALEAYSSIKKKD